MPTTTVNGTSIFYCEFGDADRPTLVLVHGLYGESSSLTSLAERFAARFHVIVPDAIGHGRSEHPASFTLEDQGRMLNALPAAVGIEPGALVGISMGSYLSAQAAVLAPSLWSHLVLVVGKAQGVTSSVAAYAARVGLDLSGVTQEEMVALLSDAMWSPATSEDRRAAITADRNADGVVLTADERVAVERSLAGFDLRLGLPAIATPTLVLSGRSDGLNPPEAGEEVASLIPDARFEVYEESGHMLPWEEQDRFVEDVTGFIVGS